MKHMSVQEAAETLFVPVSYLMQLVEKREIPSTMAGGVYRLRGDDVRKYKKRRDSKRKKALDSLAQMGRDFQDADDKMD